MAPRTLPTLHFQSQITDENGRPTPYFQRLMADWHSILTTNQKATDATVIASTPPSVAVSGSVTIYRPTTSSGIGYSAPTAAYDGNPATPATASISGVDRQQRTWLGFSALQGTASALTLKVISSVTGIAAEPVRSDVVTSPRFGVLAQDNFSIEETTTTVRGGATATVEWYDGTNWHTLYSISANGTPPVAVDVPLSTKLTDIQVRATAEGTVAEAAIEHNILEIWVEVTP